MQSVELLKSMITLWPCNGEAFCSAPGIRTRRREASICLLLGGTPQLFVNSLPLPMKLIFAGAVRHEVVKDVSLPLQVYLRPMHRTFACRGEHHRPAI